MLNILQEFSFPKNCNRKNIMNEDDDEYRGMALGLVRKWTPRWEISECNKLKVPKYRELYEKTKEYFKLNCPEPDFEYTTIQYNKNQKCAKHIDKNNIGDSYIIGFGDYTGGELIVYDKDDTPTMVDIKNKFFKFNGALNYHETNDFEGERYSLVFYKILISDD